MSGYLLSPEAEEDAFQIWRYLAQKAGLETADRIESKLFQTFELLTMNPGLRHRRSDITKHPLLFFPVRPYSYLIIYRSKRPLEIVAVLHGKRNITELLHERIP